MNHTQLALLVGRQAKAVNRFGCATGYSEEELISIASEHVGNLLLEEQTDEEIIRVGINRVYNTLQSERRKTARRKLAEENREEPTATKWCSHCNEEHPLTGDYWYFNGNKARPDPRCREYTKEKSRGKYKRKYPDANGASDARKMALGKRKDIDGKWHWDCKLCHCRVDDETKHRYWALHCEKCGEAAYRDSQRKGQQKYNAKRPKRSRERHLVDLGDDIPMVGSFSSYAKALRWLTKSGEVGRVRTLSPVPKEAQCEASSSSPS